jgi:uncharacterized membrane protein YkoI
MHRIVACVLLLIATICAAAPAQADAADHDRARSAVEAGQIRPLQEILVEVRRQVPGRMLDARLQQNGRWVYKVILLQADGQVVAVTVDARTARVLGAEGGGHPDSEVRGRDDDRRGRGGDRSRGRGKD